MQMPSPIIWNNIVPPSVRRFGKVIQFRPSRYNAKLVPKKYVTIWEDGRKSEEKTFAPGDLVEYDGSRWEIERIGPETVSIICVSDSGFPRKVLKMFFFARDVKPV